MAKKEEIVVLRFSQTSVNEISDHKDRTIYIWKEAYGGDEYVAEFRRLIKENNLKIVYFEDKKNPTGKQQWCIVDKEGYYWTGNYATHPMTGKPARLFLEKHYAKRYNSLAMAKRSAKIMSDNGVFEPSGFYKIEEYKK